VSAADRVAGLYERHALSFDRDRGRSLIEKPWLDAFLDLAPEGPILDLGCGGAEPLAAYLIARGRAVTGVDASPTLINLCRRRFPDQDWRVGDMRALSLGRAFAGVLAWDSFFHLDQDSQRAMVPRFARLAAPGAALMVTTGPRLGEAIGAYGGEPLYHASLAPEEYRSLLAAHGFAVERHVAEDPSCGGRTVWLARLTPVRDR